MDTIRSRTVVLAADDVDTDQIIPARFLTTTRHDGFGDALFADWRFDAKGTPRPGFALNDPASRNAAVLVAGRNFGCGSSREHAAWALRDYGFRAVIGASFADIFRNNALKNGLLPVVVDAATHQLLFDLIEEVPSAELTIDLATQSLTLPTGQSVTFPIDSFSKACLLQGTDELGYLLSYDAQISAYEAAIPSAA